MSRLMQKLESLVLTLGRLSLSVLSLIICIKSNQEAKVNMDGFVGKFIQILAICHSLLYLIIPVF